jgi:5'-3' exonuclease
MYQRTMLIDADITAYQIASALEETFEFNGETVRTADLEKGCKQVDKTLRQIQKLSFATNMVLFLTEGHNFRKDVLDTYKGNRLDVPKPIILHGIRDYMKANYTVITESGLEADDLLGIHATMPHTGERVIYSADKDLKTVPALHWCPEDGEPVEVTQREADRFFYEQILTGDPTDNYKGCPKVGPVLASQLLDGDLKFRNIPRVLKSGPRKGQSVNEWLQVKLDRHFGENWWTSVVSAYEKVGLTEADALIQARCARILRHGEYDFKKQKVKLWEPN